ncbi:MAG: ATP-binding cassette domain-containing protein [Acidimicrobiales bacterium]
MTVLEITDLPGPRRESAGRDRHLAQQDAPAVLEVSGLAVRTPHGAVVLDGITFCVPRGSLVAIAGPTGAGKTSLVRALTGTMPVASGSIRLRGSEVCREPALRRHIGLVPQEDILHGQLRLRRALDYGASLRLPTAAGPGERHARVEAVLAELGLARHADVRIASLSVGQRQRANMASEILGRPDILILDEPTSSLDPGYERTVMRTLRGLAEHGHSVLAVTHSMSALLECDLVLFLATGGQMAFFGPPAEAMAFFGRYDPAELFCALDDGAGEGWGRRFRASPAFARYAVAAAVARLSPVDRAVDIPGRARQAATLARRSIEQILADRRHTAMLTLQGLVLGVLLWTFLGAGGLRAPRFPGFHPGPPLAAVGIAQLLALSVSWLGLANGVREIVKERRLLRRERSAGLSVRAYVGSKFLVLGTMSMVQAAILTVIATAREEAPAQGAVLGSGSVEIVVVMALSGLAAAALGLLLSAVVRTPDKALAALPLVVVAQFVLSGLQPAVRWLPGLSRLRDVAGSYWAVQGVKATVTGDARAWWGAVAGLMVLTVAALGAAAVVVRHSLRLASGPAPAGRRALGSGPEGASDPALVPVQEPGRVQVPVPALVPVQQPGRVEVLVPAQEPGRVELPVPALRWPAGRRSSVRAAALVAVPGIVLAAAGMAAWWPPAASGSRAVAPAAFQHVRASQAGPGATTSAPPDHGAR